MTGTTSRRGTGFMNARRLILAIVVSLSTLGAGIALAAPVALAGESCPNEASRQGPSIALPECRVYEQVTPVDKGDAIELFQPRGKDLDSNTTGPAEDGGFAAEDGEAFLLRGTASLGTSAPVGQGTYVFSRGPSGWSPSVVSPSPPQLQTVETQVFDPWNLSAVGFDDKAGTVADLFAGDPTAYQDSLELGPVGGPYAALDSASGFEDYALGVGDWVGGSEDLSEAILESEHLGLMAGGPAEGQFAGTTALYELAGGQLRLVNVNSEGALLSPCGASIGQGGRAKNENFGAHSAVSSDGSKVFFTAPDPEPQGGSFSGDPNGESGVSGCWNIKTSPQENPPELYMSEREADGSFRTVEISAPEEEMVGVDPDGLQPAAFVGASADGSKVFFMTRSELTKDDTGHHAIELYEYNTEAVAGEKALTRVSGGETGGEGNVDFVGAVSSDGSAVYFTAFGELVRGVPGTVEKIGTFEHNEEGSSPVNLYRYDTLTGKTTFVATVGEEEYPLSEGVQETWAASIFGKTKEDPIDHTLFKESGRPESVALAQDANWYATGNGRFLVFGTVRPLTGFDNTKAPGALPCARVVEHSGEYPTVCSELYRYDAEAAERHEQALVCVSCAGGQPIDNAEFARAALKEVGAATNAVGPPRPISEDGSVVFFDSESALLGQAVPGREHVYEWHEGKLSMISSPTDPSEAYFLGSSSYVNARGETVEAGNVFFSTHAQLAPADTDVSDDIYDARVDGGFEGLTPSQCTGTGCQGIPGAPPIFATPASVTFAGVGNFPPVETAVKGAVKPKAKARSKAKKCKAGLQKRRGRCVKAAKKAKRSAKGRK
jgi:hypothetical protein